jgi:large subunit ribosomal protein L45
MIQILKLPVSRCWTKQFQIICLNRSYATHWDPKFKKLRRDKVVKIKFPDFEKIKKNDMFELTAEERRSRSIKEGIEPPISFEYKPINITTSSKFFLKRF